MKTKFEVTNTYFNTNPVVFHQHGRPSLGMQMKSCTPSKYNSFEFKRLVMESCCDDGKLFKARKETKFIKTNPNHPALKSYYAPTPTGTEDNKLNLQLDMFTVNNHNEHGSAVRQMRHFGMKVNILGQGITHYDHHVKIPLLIDYIPRIEKEYTMFFDSDDVHFSQGPLAILDSFKKLDDCKMLCNADAWFFPNGPIESTKMKKWMSDTTNAEISKPTPYMYLNSGVWIAETKFLQEEFLPRLKILRSMQDLKMSTQTYSDIDQSLFHYIYKDLHPSMKIDHSCKLFQSWSWSSWCDEHYKGANSLTITES
jgi:hypothetical protein